MKRIVYLTMVIVLVLTALGPSVVFAEDAPPLPGVPEGATPQVWLPLVGKLNTTYAVSGKVVDAEKTPMAGVTVKDDNGFTTVSNSSGEYTLYVKPGERVIQAVKDGFQFEPGVAKLTVSGNMKDRNFTAMDFPILNPSFEIQQYYWNPISGNANGYTPYYSNAAAATGSWSGFTGIQTWQTNLPSWSRWRTHEIYVPLGVVTATVTFAMLPYTSEVPVVMPDWGAPDKASEMPVGFDSESPDAPSIVGDWQYVAVINASTNVILGYLVQTRQNSAAWLAPVSPLSLAPWAGQTVKLELGTYNDGYGGLTNAYFDDVYVSVFPGSSTNVVCSNVLLNSNMEGAGGWFAKPAVYQSVYTSEAYYSPVRSVRSGFPVNGIWQTSEFYQTITIPSDATYARLRTRLLPRATWYYAPGKLAEPDKSEVYDPAALEAAQAQYGFIMDPTLNYTYKMLFKYFNYHSYYWMYREFDLLAYRGIPIAILFGAANDPWYGGNILYTDDVYLDVCVPVAGP